MQYKVCPKCKENKPITEFYKSYTIRMKYDRASYCKKCCKEKGKEWRENNPQRDWVINTLKNHQRRGHIINITKDELTKIAKKTNKCPICDISLDWSYGTKNGKAQKNSPSLDRKYNEKIINKNNIWIICYKCNEIKNSLPWHKFIDYCEMIVNKFRSDK